MTDPQRLAAIRTLHTVIYVIMASAVFVVVFAALTGQSGVWLWVALALVASEGVVFIGNGFRCPLTALAVRYGARTGHAFDTFLPEQVTRHTFRFFTSLLMLALLVLALRWAGIIH